MKIESDDNLEEPGRSSAGSTATALGAAGETAGPVELEWAGWIAGLRGVKDWARPLVAKQDYAVLLVCANQRGLIPAGKCAQLFGVSLRSVGQMSWRPEMKQRLARLALAELTAADALPSAAAQLAGNLFGAALAGPAAADDQGRWMERLSMALGRLGHGLGLGTGEEGRSARFKFQGEEGGGAVAGAPPQWAARSALEPLPLNLAPALPPTREELTALEAELRGLTAEVDAELAKLGEEAGKG